MSAPITKTAPKQEADERSALRSKQRVSRIIDRAPEILEPVVPFGLVVYLGAANGGYDVAVWGEVGVAAWWLLALGTILALVPRARPSRTALAAVALLALFAIWTTAGISWSESSERSVIEAARIATYLGVLVLAILLTGPGSLRRVAAGVAAGATVVAAIALLSRMQPQWFAEPLLPDFLPEARARLNHPINYWNGLAALCALAMPLALHFAASARSVVARALAAAALPVLILTLALTLSRGGWVEAAAAGVVLLALYPRRLELLGPAAIVAIGSVPLIAAARARTDFSDGLLTTQQAVDQGQEMLLLTIGVCVAVALLAGLLARVQAGGRLRPPAASQRLARAGAALVAVLLVGAAVGAAASGEAGEAWNEFKAQGAPGQNTDRLESASGNGRYQYWSTSLDAMRSEPLTGIGPGAWEFWWARNGDLPGFVRNSHSLWFDVVAETGLIGIALLVAFFGALALGVAAAYRRSGPSGRRVVAAAAAAAAAFLVAASIDWVWQLGVISIAFLLLAGATLNARPEHPAAESEAEEQDEERVPLGRRSRIAALIALPAAAIVSIVLIGIPVLTDHRMRDAVEHAAEGRIDEALDATSQARSLQPYAASPNLREAWLLELDGELEEAARAARRAIDAESTNWRHWLVLSRIEEGLGNEDESAAALAQMRQLYPRSARFGSGESQ